LRPGSLESFSVKNIIDFGGAGSHDALGMRTNILRARCFRSSSRLGAENGNSGSHEMDHQIECFEGVAWKTTAAQVIAESDADDTDLVRQLHFYATSRAVAQAEDNEPQTDPNSPPVVGE